MLQFLLAAALAASPVSIVSEAPITDEIIVTLPTEFPEIEINFKRPFEEKEAALCIDNFFEELEEKDTGEVPHLLDDYAKEAELSEADTDDLKEYCKAFSAGAAFVVMSVTFDATINDILARNNFVKKGTPVQ